MDDGQAGGRKVDDICPPRNQCKISLYRKINDGLFQNYHVDIHFVFYIEQMC